MKAIILAAWKWSRLAPLTNTTPKPLIKIFGKPIIIHTIEIIYKFVDEIIVITKYKENLIKERLWNNFKWTKISYITQWEKKWTGGALNWIKIKNTDILILNWDSIFHKKDLENIIKTDWYWCLVKKVNNPEIYWIIEEKEKWIAKQIVEKPQTYVWDLASLWVYKFNSEIFKICKNLTPSIRWEYEITDAINSFIKNNEFKTILMKKDFIDVWYPWNILQANSYFLKNLKKSKIKWKIEKNVKIKWKIILEKWSIIKSWTYIEWNIYIWENCSIWPNAYIRWNTVINSNSKIWNAVEIKNSTIGEKSSIAHLSYIWDSVIWNNVNIWWWLITANLKHNKTNIKVLIKDILIDSWLRKLWCIIWDNTKTWIKTSTYPWRIIQNNSHTLPWEIIK